MKIKMYKPKELNSDKQHPFTSHEHQGASTASLLRITVCPLWGNVPLDFWCCAKVSCIQLSKTPDAKKRAAFRGLSLCRGGSSTGSSLQAVGDHLVLLSVICCTAGKVLRWEKRLNWTLSLISAPPYLSAVPVVILDEGTAPCSFLSPRFTR